MDPLKFNILLQDTQSLLNSIFHLAKSVPFHKTRAVLQLALLKAFKVSKSAIANSSTYARALA
jgi:hypothetical protein